MFRDRDDSDTDSGVGLAVCDGPAVTVLLGGCAPARRPPAGSAPSAAGAAAADVDGRIHASGRHRLSAIADRARFGSLSGLVLDVTSGQWIGAIDDREGTRVAWLTIAFAGGRLAGLADAA